MPPWQDHRCRRHVSNKTKNPIAQRRDLDWRQSLSPSTTLSVLDHLRHSPHQRAYEPSHTAVDWHDYVHEC